MSKFKDWIMDEQQKEEERIKIFKCELYLDGEHNDDEFIAGMEIDASSREEAWEKIMEAIKIEEVEENEI